MQKEKIDTDLLVSLLVIALSALGMFSLTGFYPQMTFNLGNRVTIYGSILVSFILVIYFMNNKSGATLVFSIFIFSTLGISDHWKDWNKSQLQVIESISQNKQILNFDRDLQLFITYNQYSKLGDLSHIEFLSQGMAHTVFKIATGENYKVSTLNRRFVSNDEWLIDKKLGTKIKINEEVNVYDSKSNILVKIKKDDIQEYINKLPNNSRHWLQLLDRDNFIMKIVLRLMPRLEYAV